MAIGFMRFFIAVTLVLAGFPAYLSAQELNLFEGLEVSNNGSGDSGPQRSRRDSAGNIISAPEFTLVGTSRVGSRYQVFIKDGQGEVISVNNAGAELAVSIPRYPGYQLVDFGAGRASIKYPEDFPCIESSERSVVCSASNVAVLRLPNAAPLAAELADVAANSGVDGNTDREPPVNPFEALLEGSLDSGSDTDESATSFTPRRISPEDVPPGMRVVSTPFGDRLVEE